MRMHFFIGNIDCKILKEYYMGARRYGISLQMFNSIAHD